MKFLANENFPLTSIRLLREAGCTVVSVTEEMAGVKDSVVLSLAVREKLIVLTFDRGYGDLIYNCGFLFLWELSIFVLIRLRQVNLLKGSWNY